MVNAKSTESATRYFDPRDIEIVQKSLASKGGRFNPRTLHNPGFTPERIEALRQAIQANGLNHALLVRLDGDNPKLIAGERRLRAVQGLIEADEVALKRIQSGEKDVARVLVKNQRNKKMEPALKVYVEEGIECKIAEIADEKDALRQAIEENVTHEPLSDYEILLQCDQMEKEGWSRAEQAETMKSLGKGSEAWISQSQTLLKSNPSILKFMERGLLTRTAALTFINVPEDKVEAVLERVMHITYQEAEKKVCAAQKELDAAQDEIYFGEETIKLSEFTGNKESARKAKRQVASGSRAARKAERKLDDAKSKKDGVITVENVTQAARDVGGDADIKRPQSMKLVRIVAQEVTELLNNNHGPEIFNKDSGDKYNRLDVEMLRGWFEWMLNTNRDCEHPLDVISMVRGKV